MSHYIKSYREKHLWGKIWFWVFIVSIFLLAVFDALMMLVPVLQRLGFAK